MERLKSNLTNMLSSLTIICIFAGGVLAAVNRYTSEPVSMAKAALLEKAIKEVTPPYDNYPLKEAYKAVTPDGDSLTIYPAVKNGKQVGVAVESNSKNGFSGNIRILVGFDNEGKIVNYSVLQHTETPGLGSKMQEWFRTEKNNQNIIGRSLAQGGLSVTKDGGDVDAITASTITSRAFLQSINKAYNVYKAANHPAGEDSQATGGIFVNNGSTDKNEGKQQ